MIHQLSLQHSLFYCSEEQLDTFKSLYTKWSSQLPPIEKTPLSTLDTIAAIFNSFLAINSHSKKPVMKTSKYFSHSLSFYVLSLMDFHIPTLHFIEKSKHCTATLFLFAYHFTKKALNLLHTLLLEHKRQDILLSLKQIDYFSIKDPKNPPKGYLERTFFKYNKDLTQYFAHDYRNSSRYAYCLENALYLTSNTIIAI